MSKREGVLAVLLVMCATGWALQYHTQASAEYLNALRRAIAEHGSPLALPPGLAADFDYLCVEVSQTSVPAASPKNPSADQDAMSKDKDQTP